MGLFISSVTFYVERNGKKEIVAVVSNTIGRSDSEMIEQADELKSRWIEKGLNATYRVSRNYKLNI